MTAGWLRFGVAIALGFGAAAGQESRSLPNRAGNSKVSLRGNAITDRARITRLMGVDLGEGYVVVEIQVTPERPEGLYVSIGDFTLISRKDGERGRAMAPSEIAGSGGLIIGPPTMNGGGAIGTRAPGQGAPLPGTGIPGAGLGGGGIGTTGATEGGLAEARPAPRNNREDPRLAPLENRVLRDGEIQSPASGLLYFYMQGKVKPKDLGLIYAGPGGRLVIDFQ
jgi:hypothetical protein